MIWVKLYGPEILQGPDFIGEVKAEGKRLCVIKSGDRVYVTQYYCPHAGAPLAFGKVGNGKLICPYHRYEYDLETGRGNPGQGDYIELYPVENRADGIFAGLPERSRLSRFLFGKS
jgi:3-phenylpropionate/trans-cinnamate dioxygenase ferredoxin subunit